MSLGCYCCNTSITPGVIPSFIRAHSCTQNSNFFKRIIELHNIKPSDNWRFKLSKLRDLTSSSLQQQVPFNKTALCSPLQSKFSITQAVVAWQQSNQADRMQSNESRETPVSLNLVRKVINAGLIPAPERMTNVLINNSQSSNAVVAGKKKLMHWILTSHNVYGFALTVLHNFFDVCLQKPEDKNFINDSLVPRIRYAGFTISATVGVVYHVAIGIFFTSFVAMTLGRRESINDMCYGYWAGAALSGVGVLAGMFGVVSGNFLIYKMMEKSILPFKRMVGRYLLYVEKRINQVDIPGLRKEVASVKNAAEMIAIVQKLISIARSLLPIMTI